MNGRSRIVRHSSSVFGLVAVLLVLMAMTGCVSGGKSAASFELPAGGDGLPGAGPITRGDWFQKIWRERRQAFAQAARHDRGAVVFLGDSITHGWGDELGGNFPTLKVANRGIGGDTSRGVLVRLHEDALVLRPRAVVLLIGTNDIEQGAAPETIAANIRLIIAALQRQKSPMPVVLCSVFPSSAGKRRPADRIRHLNELLQAVAREQPQITWLDLWPLFADPAGDAQPEEFPDLLHPNPAGYAKWAGALRPVFARLGLLAKCGEAGSHPGAKGPAGASALTPESCRRRETRAAHDGF